MLRGFKIAVAGLIGLAPLYQAMAGGITYKDGDKYVKLGGRIQVQYMSVDEDGDTTDELKLRRVRPYIEGSLHKDWKGKFQWDMGKGKTVLQDIYMQYKGIADTKITVGNAELIFSREFLTSNKYQHFGVEREFVGDSSYGSPHRQTGIHASGTRMEGKFLWGVAGTIASFDPDNSKIDFEATTQIDKGDDWQDGFMFAARLGWHPLGAIKYAEGSFKNERKAGIEIAAYTWSNDGDQEDEGDGVKYLA
ncbi:MAG: hypothetical protein HQL32_16415, partial [Planctomycetes bacterium]|nr:hypothetical protein [Planctomycetota bacterium]